MLLFSLTDFTPIFEKFQIEEIAMKMSSPDDADVFANQYCDEISKAYYDNGMTFNRLLKFHERKTEFINAYKRLHSIEEKQKEIF